MEKVLRNTGKPWTAAKIAKVINDAAQDGYVQFDFTKEKPDVLTLLDNELFSKRPDLILEISNKKSGEYVVSEPMSHELLNVISGMANCKKIKIFIMIGVESPDFSFLGKMHQLEYIYIYTTDTLDLSFMKNLSNLEAVLLPSVKSLEPLTNLKLKELDVNCKDYTPLEKIPTLESLCIRSMDPKLPDLSKLSNLKNLSITLSRIDENEVLHLDKLIKLESFCTDSLTPKQFISKVVNLPALKSIDVDCGSDTHLSIEEVKEMLEVIFEAEKQNLMSEQMLKQLAKYYVYKELVKKFTKG